jgi:hypothetical protein
MAGFLPSISHLRLFGCAIYVPISPHYHMKLSPKRHLRIHVRFNSPSTIHYLKPTTDNLFTARSIDYQFDESTFPILAGETLGKIDQIVTFDWPKDKSLPPDPYTRKGEKEIQRILQLQSIANNTLSI